MSEMNRTSVQHHTELGEFAAVAKVTATHCVVCRRRLTDSESVEHGIGPICSQRFYDPVHTPTEHQVMLALGSLAMADGKYIPPYVVAAVVDNKHDARKACNFLIYWASANYENRDIVFACSAVVRDFGYTNLADKLETDRTKVSIRRMPVLLLRSGGAEVVTEETNLHEVDEFTGEQGPPRGTVEDRLVLTVTYTAKFQADMAYIDDARRLSKDGSKVRWAVPLNQQAHLEALVGYTHANELATVSPGIFGAQHAGILTVPRKRWGEVAAFRSQATQTTQITAPAAVRIEDNGSRDVKFFSPFNGTWLSEFKRAIPERDRRAVYAGSAFDHWAVRRAHLATLRRLAKDHFQANL